MSDNFSIQCKIKPDHEQLLAALKRDGLMFHGNLNDTGCNFYLDKVSTRSVSVSANGNEVEVKIYSLSSPQDCALAVDIVEAAAKLFNGEIDSETHGGVEVSALKETFIYDEWLNKSSESGARVIAHMVDEGRGPMQIPGPVRSVYIGSKALSDFRKSGDTDLTKHFQDFIKKVQYAEDSESDATRFTTGEGAEKVTLCIWFGKRTVIPPVDFVILSEGDEPRVIIKIPFAALQKIYGEHMHPLDESQFALDECSESEWARILQLAKEIEQRN